MAGGEQGLMFLSSPAPPPAVPRNGHINNTERLKILFLDVVTRHFLNLMQRTKKRIFGKLCYFYGSLVLELSKNERLATHTQY